MVRSGSGRRTGHGMRTVSVAGRVAAIAAVVAAVVIVAILLFGGGGGYSVHAVFQNAGQLVNGNQVTIEGTQAVIRQASQSGIANRYVELELPPGDKKSGERKSIPNHGTIPISRTIT